MIFFPAITNWFRSNLICVLPDGVSANLIEFAAYFATWSRSPDRNRARMTNAKHTRLKALQIGVYDLLPDQRIDRADAAMAITATAYACENYYAPKTIADKVYGSSPLVLQNKQKYLFTRMVIRGIKTLHQIETPVGVVLGKDILFHFNSMLDPENDYYDCLLVTFDWIATTTVCRTGELAPTPSKPGALTSIVTLDKLNIDGEWFKDVNLSDRGKWLYDKMDRASNWNIPYFQFWLLKTKTNSTIRRKILVTCTAGTKRHPILIYLLNTLIARHKSGDSLSNNAPLFALPLKCGSNTKFSPLTYKDIHDADQIRSQILTPTSPFPVHTHLRRRGGASDLFDCGFTIDDIKAIGHWDMGVLDVYLAFTPEYLAAKQLAGILKAEQRLDSGATSKIMVRRFTMMPSEQETHLLQH